MKGCVWGGWILLIRAGWSWVTISHCASQKKRFSSQFQTSLPGCAGQGRGLRVCIVLVTFQMVHTLASFPFSLQARKPHTEHRQAAGCDLITFFWIYLWLPSIYSVTFLFHYDSDTVSFSNTSVVKVSRLQGKIK